MIDNANVVSSLGSIEYCYYLITQHMSVSTSQIALSLDYKSAKKAAMILRALNHKLRQQIIQLLADNKRMNVTEVYVKLRLEQSVCSQQLKILRDADAVTAEREGKQIFYSLNVKQLNRIGAVIENFVGNQ